MKLQVIIVAIAMMLGTSAYAEISSVTTTTAKTITHTAKSGMHRHHHGKYHRHHGKKHYVHVKKQVVKRVVVHEGMSPQGSVPVMK